MIKLPMCKHCIDNVQTVYGWFGYNVCHCEVPKSWVFPHEIQDMLDMVRKGRIEWHI